LSSDPAFDLRFWLIEPVLLIAPVFAFLGFKMNEWVRPKTFQRWLVGLLILAGAGAAVNFGRWSLRGPVANTSLGALGYIAGITAVFALASLFSRRSVRILLSTVFSIPIVVGLGLGTVGVLGLMFIIGDSLPRHQATLSQRYGYQIRYSGGAYSSHYSEEVELFYNLPYLPLQKSVWFRSFDDHDYTYSKGTTVLLAPDRGQAIVSVPKISGGQEVDRVSLP
jgi:hypothetical protein